MRIPTGGTTVRVTQSRGAAPAVTKIITGAVLETGQAMTKAEVANRPAQGAAALHGRKQIYACGVQITRIEKTASGALTKYVLTARP